MGDAAKGGQLVGVADRGLPEDRPAGPALGDSARRRLRPRHRRGALDRRGDRRRGGAHPDRPRRRGLLHAGGHRPYRHPPGREGRRHRDPRVVGQPGTGSGRDQPDLRRRARLPPDHRWLPHLHQRRGRRDDLRGEARRRVLRLAIPGRRCSAAHQHEGRDVPGGGGEGVPRGGANPLGEGVYSSMAFGSGRIYLRGKDHLFAIGGK